MDTDGATAGPWPYFEDDEIEAAARVLRSGRVNYRTGEEGALFEREFAAWVGSQHAVAVANGTVALELALEVLGVGPGDEVITTSRTFIASASAAVMRGATPVIVDVDPVHQNLTVESVRAAITGRTRAVIAVHLAGWPCDMDGLLELTRPRGIKVIEDCAQALGATYKGRRVGSIGDIGAFSFCQDKILTTAGEGGMVTLADDASYKKAWGFKDHGTDYDAEFHREHPPGFRWLHESFGTNWRMTEIQAAVGRVALRKVPEWLRIRKRNAAILHEAFEKIPALRVTKPGPDIEHAFYKYYVFVRPEHLRPGWGRNRIMQEINEAGVVCTSGSCSEIYLEKAFTSAGLGPDTRLPVAQELGETSLMLQVHPTLSEARMRDVAGIVTEVVAEASA